MSKASQQRQRMRDNEHRKAYQAWIDGADPETKRNLKKMNLMDPEINYVVSKGAFDDEIIERERAPQPAELSEKETGPGVGAGSELGLVEALRISLCDILNPRPGATMEYEACIVGLGIGVLGLGGISEVARRFGVGRQAVSKQVKQYTRNLGLQPSVYMRSEANCDIHRESNLRKRKAASNG